LLSGIDVPVAEAFVRPTPSHHGQNPNFATDCNKY